ncbi:2-keto-4-pentenoate hydratase/2-oxohepta-3-ene-1,7-dioic acid hydratase (catechol pathway) [Blastococcus haudaquaticus]|uniref:2-keto-4-pentenoate hydratase/2-oxohepta-3-ene-1,7-dioic acid hydratase (Catechol pathway) n=1 Tax=Blastococcus haudaquaticus TaxID=1938745 RepID=A0A286GR77_9ACTN|nr:2-keto-4-pentenoate hydratase/2-oxohepta-3-ene-1,7-dioic acid hydratase (catechol pathway) [Blastococcus haudaquaticus]
MLATVPTTIDHAGSWALARLSADGRPFPALVSGDRALDLSASSALGQPSSTRQLLDRWDDALPVLDELAGSSDGWQPLAGLTVLAPVEPRQVFQAGANYRTHVIDIAVAHADGSDGRTVEQVRADAAAEMDTRLEHPPYVFQGLPSAICGAYDDVVLPSDGKQPDWELELAAVIGRRARRVSPEDALDVVAGWTIVNDLTLRERIFRKDAPALGADWLAAKNSPTFLPTGPVVVPRAAVPDPGDLRLTLRLNGEVMQDESTKDMLFDVAHVIAHCSSVATLLPGDLVLTGSPAGNGLPRGRLLRAGDRMDSTITGLGAQANRCVDE